ncbi:uncharacterized protein LOC114541940 isoform X2 [Dendronephthya gigantea]|uniref:uncharacterized protein LOC114541940 isoform X2 n=1 Tax=Dendronephthya gigantea TaxID=151771 RepID=UPI001069E9AF|nr:uncharacterized protein LOC114541940 isoform X2 [Dendronephthya gigantea]
MIINLPCLETLFSTDLEDDYNCLCEVMKNYLSTGTTQTPSRGRGQRNGKRSDRLDYGDDKQPLEAPAKKQKTAKKKVTNSIMSHEHIAMLKEKVRGKQPNVFFEGNSPQSSDDESGSEVDNMRRVIDAKDREIESLKRQIADMKDMQNLQDVVTQLKHSVGILDQLASVGFKCKQQGIGAPDTIKDVSKRPSSPTVTIANKASSSDSESDSILLCPGVEISKGQKRVLSSKLSAKDFVYSALPIIWSREVLCTHSVTGRKCNAHKEREAKPQLDAEKVDSLCSYVEQKFGVTQKEVRNLMTTKINNIIKCCKQQKIVEQKND